jgi:flagellar hook-associated protein 1 FlgK
MAGNALQANDIGLQVTGQNIANANTPGYIREQLELTESPPQQMGSVMLGTGVQVQAVVAKVDNFLQERLQSATSDQASADSLQGTYSQLEQVVGALNDSNLSTSIDNFFSSVNDVLNQPGDISVLNQAVLQGQSLTQAINQMASQAEQVRSDVNTDVSNMAGSINALTSQIGALNLQIEQATGGSGSTSSAIGLQDQRLQALQSLSQLVGINTIDQPNGSVSVYVGGEYLVDDGNVRTVTRSLRSDGGQTVCDLRVQGTNALLSPSSGELQGLLSARDSVIPAFLDNLNSFSAALVSSFNQIYSSGQGLSGYSTVTSESAVDKPNQALNATGLTFSPTSGSFQVLVQDTTTGTTQTNNINIDLSGLHQNTTLADLAAQLNAVSGIQATIGSDNRLTITSTSPDQQFSFANDTSGVLASLGINTFFTGSTAAGIGINATVQQDPGTFAVSQGGIANDTDNAVQLAQLASQPLASQNGNSLTVLYENMVNDVTQGSAQAQSTATAADTYQQTLSNQQLAVSGVSIDDETIQMLSYQQAYEATAKYISTLDDLFKTLVQL